MKYKNIKSAIHNFGHSFISDMNYVDDGFINDEINSIHKKGYDIKINWFTNSFEPKELKSERIIKSIGLWKDWLKKHLASHQVDINNIQSLYFIWPAQKEKYMVAVDDKSKEHKIDITKT